MKKIITLFIGLLFVTLSTQAKDEFVASPNKKVGVRFKVTPQDFYYTLFWDKHPITKPSSIKIKLKTDSIYPPDWGLTDVKRKTVHTVWTPIVGKRSSVTNSYNEISFLFSRPSSIIKEKKIVFRVYDEGIAFRHIMGPNEKKQITLVEEASYFTFIDGLNIWNYDGEKRPQGPESLLSIKGTRRYPIVMKCEDDYYWLAITEAALSDVGPMQLEFSKNSYGYIATKIPESTVTTPSYLPWRVIMVSKNPADFIDSDMLVNLSPPPKGDFSWVKPGVSFWDWRAWGYKAKDGFTYDLEINSWKRFIDFAAETKIPYLLLDANWYGDEHSNLSDPFKGGKAAQVRKALDYAKTKNVGLILYLNDKASVNFSVEEIIKAYASWGAAGIKYGFMRGKGQEKVRKTERIVKACAENHLLVDFHDGPIPPTGHERTWPNWITREYLHAQSDAKYAHTPSDFVLMAYLNTIAGPLDGNHGLFAHKNATDRPRIFQEVPSTIVAEAARTLILYSGLTVIPDAADAYREHLDLFGFISAQKQPWKQSKTIGGKFGKWILTMRQARDNTYLIAAANDHSERIIKIPFTFLKKGVRYNAQIFTDAEDATLEKNRDKYLVKEKLISSEDTLAIRLSAGGGCCIILRERK